MSLFYDFDLLSVALAVITFAILGVIVFLNNRRSKTNQIFLIFTLLTIIYGVINYLTAQIKNPFYTLWLLRSTIFISTWHAFTLFELFYVFPADEKKLPKHYSFILIPLVCIISILTLTPLIFSGITEIGQVGQVAKASVAPGIALFIVLVTYLIAAGCYFLFKKTLTSNINERRPYKLILIGTILTFSLIFVFIVILGGVFLNVQFIPLVPIFFVPFIALTSYAIIKHHLFNVKVIATELLTFALWLTLLIRLVTAATLGDRILNGFIFTAAVVLGIFLIRSVFQEVRMREKMGKLALDLEITNKELKLLDEAKSDFISIASHQLRTPLSIIKGYISMIREGTYGKIDEKLNDPIHKVYVSNERLINLVSDLLDLSRMERGKMQYEFLPIRLGEVAEGIVQDFEKVAKDKGLAFSWEKSATNDLVKGDAGKLRQVVLNLIDNAIKYTSAGSIAIEIENISGNRVRFSVTDTGPGLTTEEAHALFQKFSRGQEESKAHTEGLGLGLYVAKLIAQAHGGELAVTSPGKGKGSTFSLTLPVYNETQENFKKFASEI